jgi:LmbE family N-acetylglucosaminyl deacetylase
MNKVLFIAVHPDDETLGCGGAILKHKYLGDEIYWLIITNISESLGYSPEQVEGRNKEINRVTKIYGFNDVFKLDFPTTKLDTIPIHSIILAMSKVVFKVKPDVIYVSNRSDIHTDHQITFKAAMSCTKNFRCPFIKRILMYECLSETEFAPSLPENTFIPSVFVDISPFLEEKIKIMNLYQCEQFAFPFPRSDENIRALARYRGATAGTEAAEAFVLLREVM